MSRRSGAADGPGPNLFRDSAAAPGVLRGLWVAAVLYCVVRHIVLVPLTTPAQDFRIYRRHAVDLMEGRNPYEEPIPFRWDDAGYVYPLFFMTFVAPLTAVGPVAGEVMWWAVSAALWLGGGIGAGWLARRLSGRSWLERIGGAGWLAAVFVAWSLPAAVTLRWGQSNLIVLTFIVAALWAGFRERRGWAGLWLAVAILCKGQPVLLLPAFAALLGRRGLAVLVAVGALYVLTLGVTGAWVWEWELWSEKAPRWAMRFEAQSASVFHLLARRHGVDATVANRWGLGCEAAVLLIYLAGLVWLLRRGAGRAWAPLWGLALVPAASRFMEFHHLVWLIPPQVGLVVASGRTGRVELLFWAAVSASFLNLGQTLFMAFPAFPSEYFYHAGVAGCAIGVARAALSGGRGAARVAS